MNNVGVDAYIARYERTKLPRNYEFYDWLFDRFGGDQQTSLFIDTDRLDEILNENPELKTTYAEELKILREILESEGGCVDLHFG